MHLAYKNKLSKIKKRKRRKHFQGERIINQMHSTLRVQSCSGKK